MSRYAPTKPEERRQWQQDVASGTGASATATERLIADIERLEAVTCSQPGVAQCAKKWEADHQGRILESYGLRDEFPYDCDAIDYVVNALIASRAQARVGRECAERLQEAIGFLMLEAATHRGENRHEDAKMLDTHASIFAATVVSAREAGLLEEPDAKS